MKTTIRNPIGGLALLSALVLILQPNNLRAQGTAFTYQGRLDSGGAPYTGLVEMQFSLWDAASGGSQLGSPFTIPSVSVSNGLFTVSLDFGAGAFSGPPRWLEIAVRTNGAPSYQSLLPRQPITPTPYAIRAANLSGTIPANQLSGALAAINLPSGGNWPLSSTLTLNSTTLAIDPINNRVGIGTASPAWPFHQVAGQSVALLESTATPFGSVLELRNNTASASYLGAINFNNAAGAFPGQIGYHANDVLTFRVAGAQRMELLGNGQLSVFGTAARGVYAESTGSGGIGVFGFAGPSGSASPGNGNTGVYGESAQNNGNGVVGVANSGPSAYGVWGLSTSGFAGAFEGAVKIYGNSSHTKPFLQLHESEDGDYARIQLQVANRPLWHISVGGPDNSLVFYNSANSIVSSLSESGTLTTRVLTITGGADIAEPFAMSEPDLPKGAVVVIDEEHPGHLKLSTEPYDRRVAGVISGAGGVNPGLSLSQQGVLEGNQQVALTGRVYVQADTSNGPIKPGDLLTTSATPGHAMKVTDHARAQGAILGKAMTGFAEGKGLVLVLVTLQ